MVDCASRSSLRLAIPLTQEDYPGPDEFRILKGSLFKRLAFVEGLRLHT